MDAVVLVRSEKEKKRARSRFAVSIAERDTLEHDVRGAERPGESGWGGFKGGSRLRHRRRPRLP